MAVKFLVVLMCIGGLKAEDIICKKYEAKSGFNLDKIMGFNIMQAAMVHPSGGEAEAPANCSSIEFTRNDTGTYLIQNGDTTLAQKMTFEDESKGYANVAMPFISPGSILGVSTTWLDFGEDYEYQVYMECLPIFQTGVYYIFILHPKGKDVDEATMKKILKTIKEKTQFEDPVVTNQYSSCAYN